MKKEKTHFVKKLKVFRKPAFFVCKQEKICYNRAMQNQGKRQNSKYNAPKPLPYLTPTQAKASGVAYSAVIMISLILSLIASIALGVMGVVITEKDVKPNWYIYLNYLLPQITLFLTAALYFAWLKRPIAQAAKEQKCHPKYFLLAVLLQIGLLSLGTLNDAFLRFLERFGYKQSALLLPDLNGVGLFATIFCVAVLPAVFEEIFFRGILLKGLRSFGTIGSIFLCGALFSLYHQNPIQTVYQFACGVAFAFMAIKAGSILPTVLSHFLNNTLIIVLTRFGIESIPTAAYVPYVIVTSLCLIGTLAYLFFFDEPKTEVVPEKRNQEKQRQTQEKKLERVRFFVCAAVGIAVFAINWITSLMKGF